MSAPTRSFGLVAGAVLAAGACLAGGAAAGAEEPALAPRATAVGVAEREFRISLYRRIVPAGPIRLNVRNFGEDAHDLVLYSPSGRRRLAATAEIRSGRRETLSVRLVHPGSYRLLCGKRGHAAAGMRARLRVVAPR